MRNIDQLLPRDSGDGVTSLTHVLQELVRQFQLVSLDVSTQIGAPDVFSIRQDGRTTWHHEGAANNIADSLHDIKNRFSTLNILRNFHCRIIRSYSSFMDRI